MTLDVTSILAVANLLPDPVLFVRKKGAILAANNNAVRALDLDLDKSPDMRLHHLCGTAPDHIDEILKRYSRVSGPIFEELILRTRQGILTPYRCDGARLPRNKGPEALLMLRLRSKEQVAQKFGALSDRVRQMEGAIRFQRSANRILYEKGHAKSLLLAQLGHELRTPLNAVMGFAHVLRTEASRREGLGPMLEYSSLIGDAGQHLLNIINNVTDTTRLEAGSFQMDEEIVDLAELVREAVTLATTSPNGRQEDRILLDLASNFGDVCVDKGAIKQVIINLVSNALKFTPKRGRILVKMGFNSMRGVYVQVADNGPGIKPEDIQRIFTPFQQTDEERRTGKRRGTGLGLGLSRQLVEMHGGNLDFQSQPGLGTTVTVWLPLSRLHVVDKPAVVNGSARAG